MNSQKVEEFIRLAKENAALREQVKELEGKLAEAVTLARKTIKMDCGPMSRIIKGHEESAGGVGVNKTWIHAARALCCQHCTAQLCSVGCGCKEVLG